VGFVIPLLETALNVRQKHIAEPTNAVRVTSAFAALALSEIAMATVFPAKDVLTIGIAPTVMYVDLMAVSHGYVLRGILVTLIAISASLSVTVMSLRVAKRLLA